MYHQTTVKAQQQSFFRETSKVLKISISAILKFSQTTAEKASQKYWKTTLENVCEFHQYFIIFSHTQLKNSVRLRKINYVLSCEIHKVLSEIPWKLDHLKKAEGIWSLFSDLSQKWKK